MAVFRSNRANRYKSWSKEVGSAIQSQTDFTFGGEKESTTSPYHIHSYNKRKRTNSLTPEKVEELPIEHTNGRMDTGSEKDSAFNITGRHIFDALYDNHEDSCKMDIMPQLYANENEETQLIISDLESTESMIKQKRSQISEENVKRLNPRPQDLNATIGLNSLHILKSAVGKMLSKNSSIRNPTKEQRETTELFESKITDSMNSNSEMENGYRQKIMQIKERIIDKIQNKRYM